MSSSRMTVALVAAATASGLSVSPAATAAPSPPPVTVAWGTTPSAPAGARGELFGAAAVPGQAWAVGGTNPGIAPTSGLTSPYAEHWDGRRWTATPVSVPTIYPGGAQTAQLEGAAAISGTDAWAVGSVKNRSSLASRTLAYHWDGAVWTRVSTPNPAGASLGNHLHAVAARSATAVFAAGDQGYPPRSLVLRFNGSRWSPLATPDIGTLRAIAVDPASVWVASLTTVQRYDGSRWSALPALPVLGGTSADLQLSGLAKSAAGLWVVGTHRIPYFDGSLYRPYAAVWDGVRWTSVGSSVDSGFSGVTASGGTVWASSANAVTRLTPARSTTEVTPVTPPGLLTAVASDSAGHAWAVGWGVNGSTTLPTIIDAPSATQGGFRAATAASDATVTWIGPVTGSGRTDTSGVFATGGLPAGSYTLVASLTGCPTAVATVTVEAGIATPVTVPIVC